jgi:hypothetical protein
MLSRYLRQIANEKTESDGSLNPGDGRVRMMSKAEALARQIWRLALGWKEDVKVEKDGKVKMVEKHHPPDPKFVDIVLDRIEGKVAAQGEDKVKKQPLSERVSDLAKRKLNAMVEETSE